MNEHVEHKIALLIDGDNAQSKYIENILTEAGKKGKVTIRRIYGDWTDSRLSGWKEQINKYAIRPMQKFAFAKGKNSTDTAMIIDAMDILHSKAVTGFCIASSDSDYTGLAQRIREEGVMVMGIGEAKKTTDAFVNACDIFIYTENLSIEFENSPLLPKKEIVVKPDNQKQNGASDSHIESGKLSEPKILSKITLPQSKITKQPIDLSLLIKAYEMVEDDNGLAYMGEIGVALRKINPSFDSRTYGYSSIASLFRGMSDFFEFVYKDNGTSLYIRLKNNQKES